MSEVNIPLTVVDNNQVVGMEAGAGVIKAVSPTVDLERVSTPNPGVKITVKDVRGEHSETVLDGSAGDPSALIDDTAAAAGKTYSSNKIEAELTPIKSDLQEKYVKPSGGIPATDIAEGVIPNVSGKLDAPAQDGTQGQALLSNGSGGQVWGDVLERQSTVAVDDGIVEMTQGSGGGGSSGSAMGLIDELTTAETKTSIKLEFNKLSEFVIIVEIPVGAGSGNVTVKINGTQYRTMGSAIASGSKRYLGVRYAFGCPFVEYLNASNDGSSTPWTVLCSAAGTYTNYTTWKSGFTSLEFGASTENVPFPVGTIVKLYGREVAA